MKEKGENIWLWSHSATAKKISSWPGPAGKTAQLGEILVVDCCVLIQRVNGNI